MAQLDEIISQIKKLEPLPQVTTRVLALVEDPDSSMSQLAKVIMYDQALTANILRICNSAYFGISKKVESLQQAIVYLGMEQIIDLVLMFGASRNLRKKQPGYDLDEGQLWRYSVCSALIARDLAEKFEGADKHLIFTGALLKDIGKVVLHQYVGESFRKIITLVIKKEYSFREAEKEVIGIDHAELGAMVADSWNFSPNLTEIIRNHHLSNNEQDPDLNTSLVYLADIICMMIGVGVGSDGLAYRLHKKVIDNLGFTILDLGKIIAEFGDKVDQVEEIINLSNR